MDGQQEASQMLKRWRVLITAIFAIAAPATALAARGYATNTVNMRAGPGTEYPVVDTIPAGAHVTIHGCLSDYAWCDVSWRGDRGWVASSYLNYFYRNEYVYLPDYVGVIDVPIVTFALGPYWSSYYVGRPWYHRRAYWQQVWRSHGRYGYRGYAPPSRIVGRPGPGRNVVGRPGRPPGGPVQLARPHAPAQIGQQRGPRFVTPGARGPQVGAHAPQFGARPGPRFGGHLGGPRPQIGVQRPQFGGGHAVGGPRFGGTSGFAPGARASGGLPMGGAHFGGGAPRMGAPHMGGAPRMGGGGGPRHR
jgi:uncharacterized protein YraI